jgi:predicted pyridoxine 5'-phosphate oxidase superfamily flavin-nucleotide-binding protein
MERHEGPIVLSTADQHGVPNAIYAMSMKMLDDGRIVVADNYFHKTKSNIRSGSNGAVLFMTKGTAPRLPKAIRKYPKDGEEILAPHDSEM